MLCHVPGTPTSEKGLIHGSLQGFDGLERTAVGGPRLDCTEAVRSRVSCATVRDETSSLVSSSLS